MKPENCQIDQDHTHGIQEWCTRNAVQYFTLSEVGSTYLSESPVPPRHLYVQGNSAALKMLSIAVVGTRRPSRDGIRAGISFAAGLAESGFCVVSGLAHGVDGAAHQGALEVGGFTVAVLGHGLDRIYPTSHRSLAERILQNGGALVSEYPPGVAPLPHHFPRRNRIIAGLSLGTLVVEAAPKSGSLITARLAMDAGRDVFVVPGTFDRPEYSGGHALIQDGAKLVTTVQEIIDEYPRQRWAAPRAARGLEIPFLEDAFRVLGGSASLGELVERSGREVPEVARAVSVARSEKKVCEIYPQHFVWVETPRYAETL